MGRLLKAVGAPFSAVETFLDGIKLGYKWRFDRWKHLCVLVYRGFGTPDAMALKGRVLDDRVTSSPAGSTSAWENLVNMLQRYETDEIPGACVRIHYGPLTVEAETDRNGYFDVTLHPPALVRPDDPWQEVTVDLLAPAPKDPAAVRTTGRLLVPLPDVEFGVVSDLDDTVVRTGATNFFQHLRTVMLNNAGTRIPFDGVAGFYQALCEGPDGRGHNPLFYVSSSPWNLYDLFDAFMAHHDIPAGPIFLKDFGFGEGKFIKTGHTAHKLACIRTIFDTYPHLPFVLIGDSGQHDPEVYRAAVATYPDRIRAVYIRDVSPPRRDAEVRTIAREVEAMGVPMRLVADTEAAARHAAAVGLIRPAAASR